MAIANKNDLTHVVRTTQQWESSYDKYECIPEGVLCIEFTTSGQALAKIGNGHDIFSKLPYIGGADLTNYFTKEQTTECINDILKAKRYICIKGILNNKNQLPTNATCGDLYFVISQNQSSSNKYDEYVYSPSNTWENLGSIPIDIDLSEYAKIVYVDEKIDEVNERIDDIEQHGTHTHANKDILDLITAAFTAEEKDKLSTLYNYDDTELRELITQASHTHSNKDILDAITAAYTAEEKEKLSTLKPVDVSTIEEKITALERLAHEHSNKRILDRTTASFTTEYERKMRWIRLYTGCTGMEEGIAGLVPAAQAGEEDYVLSGAGEWVPQTGGGGTYTLPIATASTLGGIKVGDGLEIDENGVLSATGGGGSGDSIAEGDGITITTDPQTGVKTISVNVGTGLEIDPVTGELNVTGGGNYSAGEAINIRNVSGNLPPGYVEVDYIEGNGNCYTVIDYIPNRKTKIVGSAALISTTNDPVLFGARTGSNGNQFVLWFNRYDSTQAKVGFVYGTNTWSTSTDCNDGRLIPYVVGEQFTFLLSLDDEFNINDTFVHNITENGAPADYLKLGIFALVDDSLGNIESDNQIFAGRMYEFKIYEDDVLVVELIPAVNSATGSVGFYDAVNDKFYTSNRSTQFTYDPSTVHVSGKIIDVKYGNGLSVNQDNELEVNTGDGLQINQDGEVEIDPSIIPDVPEYRAGKAILIDSYSSQLTPTDFSNTDFIASITGVTAGTITKAADNSSITIATWGSDCYTSGSGGGSAGSYSFTVKPSTKYRMEWEVTNSEARNRNMIFENSGFDHVYAADTSYDTFIEFTTTATANSITTRLGLEDANVAQTFSNINLYEVLEETLEYDTISVSYKNGLKVNEYNQLEVNVGNGLYIDHSQIDPTTFSVQNQKYFFDEVNVTATINGSYGPRSFIKLYADDCLFALCDVLSGGNHYNTPILVGLTADSVKIRVDGSYGTSSYGPNITFDYRGKTWYCTSGYGITNSDMTDQTGTLQSLPTVYEISTEAEYAIIGKDLIDTAILLPDPDVTTVNAKLGSGLSFDANGAIEVNTGNGLQIDPQTGAINVTGGGSGDTVEAGDGIDITTDSQTGNKVISVITQELGGLTIDEDTNGLKISQSAAGKAIDISDVITFDSWNNGTGWANEEYYDNTSDGHIPWGQNLMIYPTSTDVLFRIPDGITQAKCSATSTNPSTILKTGLYFYNSQGVHFAGPIRYTDPDTIIDIPAGSVYVNQSIRTSNDDNISSSNVAGATITWLTDGTKIDVKYGTGLTINQDNELSVDIGDRLHFDSNNALAVNPYYEGEGISIHAIGVPTGYTRVKALSSTDGGNQYIDTGYKINANTVIEMKAVFYKYGSNAWKIPLGTRNSSYDAENGMLFLVTWASDQPGNNPSLWIERVKSVAPSDKKDEFYNDIVNIRIAGTSLTCTNTRTGVTTVLDTETTMPASQYSLFVFATNDHSNPTFYTQMDLHSLTISEADTVIHQYIPCKRDSDDKYGLYDTIDQEFKLSPNNALFTYVAGTPSGDDPLMEEISLLPATASTLGGIKVGNGLEIDANGVLSTTGGGGGGDSIDEGAGIEITTDPLTDIKTISINYGTGLTVDPITNALMTDGQLPEGTIIKKLTYTGTGTNTNNIQFDKKPLAILSLNGSSGQNYGSLIPTFIDSPYLHGVYGGPSNSGTTFRSSMSYDDSTNVLSITNTSDEGLAFNIVNKPYVMYYLIKGYAGSGTSVNNEVSVIKTISYTGTGTSTNNIQLPETPNYILGINGRDGVSGDMVVFPFDNLHPSDAHQYIYTFCYNSGISTNYFAGGHGEFTFNSSTNILTLTGGDQGAACNYLDRVYYLRYVVNETISSYEYTEGGGISITPDPQTGENIISVNVGSGLSIDPNTGELNVTGGGGGSGDTVAEGAGISITTDQQTGNKVIAVNAGSGLQVNQTTNELEVSSGVVTSIAPTQNTPGSITVTEGDGTTTPVSVISQMGGATSSTAGTAGYVPAPAAGDDDAYLRGDGTWDDSVVTEDDELTLVFVPDDYQPS